MLNEIPVGSPDGSPLCSMPMLGTSDKFAKDGGEQKTMPVKTTATSSSSSSSSSSSRSAEKPRSSPPAYPQSDEKLYSFLKEEELRSTSKLLEVRADSNEEKDKYKRSMNYMVPPSTDKKSAATLSPDPQAGQQQEQQQLELVTEQPLYGVDTNEVRAQFKRMTNGADRMVLNGAAAA